MVKRVLIQGGASAAMLVSLPGIDVTGGINCDQTCFDSRWSGLIFYRKGTIDSANDVAAAYGYGETLPTPPMLFGYVRTLAGGAPTTAFGNSFNMLRGGGIDQWWYAEMQVNQFIFRAKFGAQASRLWFAIYQRPAG